jgi:predicted permease
VFTTFSALAPVFLVILAGFGMRRLRLMEEEAWSGLEHLCYYVLFPALLIKTLSRADIAGIPLLDYASALVIAILLMSLLLLLIRLVLRITTGISDESFTSLFQGSTRWHGFIALSIAGSLYGNDGITFTAIIIAVIIPAVNIINVSILAIFVDADFTYRRLLNQLATNPLIFSCFVGIAINISGLSLPDIAFETLDILGAGGLGMSLLVVGAGIRPRMHAAHKWLVALSIFLRLIVMPSLMFIMCSMFGISGTGRTMAVIAGAVPTAASSYVLARKMGGDAPLMANIITFQVMVASITLPIAIYLAQ